MRSLLYKIGLSCLGISFYTLTPRQKPVYHRSFSSTQELVDQNNLPERAFVIIIPSFNNEQWCELNLQSVFAQEYSNYRVIYIDDDSTEKTYERASGFVYKNHQDHRVLMIHNEKRRGALANLYYAIHSCGDHETVVALDGDDMLGGWWEGSHYVPDKYILKRLNEVYASREIWLTFGQFQDYPSGQKGWAQAMPSEVIAQNGFREWPHIPTHLRTFHAALFKKIKLQDLLFKGDFFPMTWDQAMMFPMIEMAGERHAFIDHIMYSYNSSNSINDHKIGVQLQRHLAKYIRAKPRYQRLENIQNLAPYVPSGKDTNLMIFSNNGAPKLYALLESIHKHVQGIDHCYVIYVADTPAHNEAYATVKKRFPHVEYVHVLQKKPDEFRSVVIFNFLLHFTQPYTLFAHDNLIITHDIDLRECIQALESTGAYGFYLTLGKNITQAYPMPFDLPQPLLHKIYPSSYAWVFEDGQGNWACPYNFDMTLYRTPSIKPVLLKEGYTSLEDLDRLWSNDADLAQAGACFEHSRVTKIRYKHVPSSEGFFKKIDDQLLEQFQRGYDIDTATLQTSKNSVIAPYQPTFSAKKRGESQ
jgi:glycosyltransferase involved in cell wall biosynthesis